MRRKDKNITKVTVLNKIKIMKIFKSRTKIKWMDCIARRVEEAGSD